MTEQLKQRVWGMVILVAVGVVFLPDLLDGKKETTKSDFKKIPTPPVFDQSPQVIEFPQQQLDETIAKVPAIQEETAQDTAGLGPTDSATSELDSASSTGDDSNVEQNDVTVVSKASTESEFKEVDTTTDSMPESLDDDQSEAADQSALPKIASRPLWILQLGSFKHKENVVALREKLDKAGIKTFTKPITTKAGILSKVYVGPEEDKSKLVDVQKKLKEVTGLAGKITRYSPIN